MAKFRWCLPGAVMLALALVAANASAAPDLAAMRKLILEGRAAQAYTELSRVAFANAGQPDFDYLLGLAALQSGHPARATLAFERVLAVDPHYLGARLDMARAYFLLGDDELARRMFEELRRDNPPPAARQAIDGYLAALAKRARPVRWSAYLEMGGGYDSNADNATALGSVFVPALGASVNLTSASTQRHSWFLDTRGEVRVQARATRALTLFATAEGSMRNYAIAGDLDTRDFGLQVGGEVASGSDTYRYTVGYSRNELDYNDYRNQLGVTAEWGRALDARTRVTGFGQISGLRYQQPAVRAEDSTLALGGAGLEYALDAQGRTVVSTGLFGGRDFATNGRIDGDRNLLGLRVGAQRALGREMSVFVNGGAQFSFYGQTNALFAKLRRDRLYDVNAGVGWAFLPKWNVRAQLRYVRNQSNVSIDSYQRTEIGLWLRRSFE